MASRGNLVSLYFWSALASTLNSALAGAKEASIITETQYSLFLQPKLIVYRKLERADRVPINGNKDVSLVSLLKQQRPSKTKPSKTKPTKNKPTKTKPTKTKPTKIKPNQQKPNQPKPNQLNQNQTN